MKSEGWSLERAMAALGIPVSEKSQYGEELPYDIAASTFKLENLFGVVVASKFKNPLVNNLILVNFVV